MFARAEVIAPNLGLDHLVTDNKISAAEAQLVRDNFPKFIMAMIDRSTLTRSIFEVV